MGNKIETRRLILREWEFTDITDMINGLNNYDVARNFGTPFPYTKEDAEAYIKKTKKIGRKNYYFAITFKESDRAIGGCGIHFKEDIVTMGLWLNEKCHGDGYGTEALRGLAKYGFEELGIEKYNNDFFEGNMASFQIQRKIGSRIEDEDYEEVDCSTLGGKRKRVKTVLTKEEFI